LAGMQLDPAIESMDIELRRELYGFRKSEGWVCTESGEGPESPPTWASHAAAVRGEIGLQCTCDCGRPRQVLEHPATGTCICVTFDMRPDSPHTVCLERSEWHAHQPGSPTWMPDRFKHHRTLALKPYPQSPLSEEAQIRPINILSGIVQNLAKATQKSWLLVGPAGCSKTTYIAAVLNDLNTLRWTWAHPKTPHTSLNYLERLSCEEPKKRTLTDQICIWRVKVPDWLEEMHRYDTRDFDGPPCPEPAVTVESIRTQCKAAGFTPVIWLEELDKFRPTRPRTNYLYRLIDGVYEMGGTIIASANLTLPELREHLGDAIYRRISGANDDDGDHQIMDLHDLAKMDKAVRVRKSRAT
jgi:hypothetical protein